MGVLYRCPQNVYTKGDAKMSEVNLRGLVVSKHKTLRNFAKAMNWSERKTAAIVNGKQEPNASDIEAMAKELNISVPEEFRRIFFTR